MAYKHYQQQQKYIICLANTSVDHYIVVYDEFIEMHLWTISM